MKTYEGILPEIQLKNKKGNIKKFKVTSSSNTYEVAKELFDMDTMDLTEEFIAIYLNRANNTIGWFRVSTGGMSATIVENRLILKVALDVGAHSIIIMHNHPSGNNKPSNQDAKITGQLKDACKLFDINLLDHLIVTSENGYYSFADNGML